MNALSVKESQWTKMLDLCLSHVSVMWYGGKVPEYCALSHDDFGGSCPWCLSIDAQHKFPRHVFPTVSNRATFVVVGFCAHLLQSPHCSQRKV